MEGPGASPREIQAPDLPATVLDVAGELGRAGHAAHLAGECLRDLLLGRACTEYELLTDASPEALLGLFPRAVPTGPFATLPTPAGPVDLLAAPGEDGIRDALARRDFRVHAVAFDPRSGAFTDPHGGRSDLAAGILRCVGGAERRIASDPLVALRAIRVEATRGLELAAELEAALARAPGPLRRAARTYLRWELDAILLAPGVARAAGRLERSGITRELAPGARPGCGPLLGQLPANRELRLAAWLRGASARRALQQLRYSPVVARRVALLASLHPLDALAGADHPAGARRLLRRAGLRNLRALATLADAEIRCEGPDAAARRQRLRAAEAAIDAADRAERAAAQRSTLAIGGTEVMKWLGCGPGPQVGRALAHLAARVERDPASNEPARLRAALLEWASAEGR